MLIRDWFDSYIDGVLPLKKPATRASFTGHLRKFELTFGHLDLNELTEQAVQEHLTAISKKLAPKTLQNYWGTIKLVLTRALRQKLITFVPSPDLPKNPKHDQQILTVPEMVSIMRAGRGLQEQVFIAVLAETGLRIGEILALKPDCVNYEARTLTIKNSVFRNKIQSPKTDSALRTIAISESLAKLLESLAVKQGRFFKQSASCWLYRLHNLQKSLGMAPTGFHAFRRGNATVCASILGMPEKVLAMRLGHAGEGLTLGTYAQNVQNADREYVAGLEKLIFGGVNAETSV